MSGAPVPEIVAESATAGAVLVKLSTADRDPLDIGLNLTSMVQLAPGAKVLPMQEFRDKENSPVVVKLVDSGPPIVSSVPPEFVAVIVCIAGLAHV